MKLNKKKKFIIVFLVFITAFFIYQMDLTKDVSNEIPSQCYTKIQPPAFVLKNGLPIYTKNSDLKYVRLDYKNMTGGYIIDIIQVKNTGSMRPAISDSSFVIIIKNITKKDVNVGDIVLINRFNNTGLLHRTINVSDGLYTTKGDNNNIADKEKWKFEQIEGKVIGVLY